MFWLAIWPVPYTAIPNQVTKAALVLGKGLELHSKSCTGVASAGETVRIWLDVQQKPPGG